MMHMICAALVVAPALRYWYACFPCLTLPPPQSEDDPACSRYLPSFAHNMNQFKLGMLCKCSTMEFDTKHQAKPYVYEALEPTAQQFRLIHVTRDNSGAIHCDLTTFDLQALPEYFCLSYTWGSPTPLRRINVNAGHLDVRENLFHFLEEYCHQPHAYIWIDQISIDQSNVHERGHQVGMMAKIFKQAACVIIWLGNDERYIKVAIHLNDTRVHAIHSLEWGTQMSTQIASLALLARNVYFTRLWVVQEIVLAKDLRLLVKDGAWVPWAAIRKWRWRIEAPRPVRWLLTARENRIHCYGLGHYITYFSGHSCHDPLDRVYGLLGLTGQVLDIIPDYTKSVQELYFDVTRALCIGYSYKSKMRLSTDLEETNIALRRNLRVQGARSPTMRAITRHLDKLEAMGEAGDIDVGFESTENQKVASDDRKVRKAKLKGRWWLEAGGQRTYFY